MAKSSTLLVTSGREDGRQETAIALELKDLYRSIERADAELAKELVRQIRELTKWSANQLRAEAPVGYTGKLKKSIRGNTSKTRSVVRGAKHTWFVNYGRKSQYPFPANPFVHRTEERIGPMVEKAGQKIIERTAKKFVGE